jgi:hypothetical protein
MHVLWYACLLGLAIMVIEKVTGGITGGLKTGLGKSLGI